MNVFIPKRAALYCRLSCEPDGSLEKAERQEADDRAMGARLSWPEFCCVYVDVRCSYLVGTLVQAAAFGSVGRSCAVAPAV
ncbi:hypothetical protein J1792_23325 [Streptomyces triculaminicus]|uniref:Uncharacterized protein n=1 Tax=Streptomyces triculaminicus TaxID=2816232 RepID=A0A939JQI4_9ACTN|nr:hypothetical protein [Streptomyces triculaminicus]MBO0655603.1 hypothetical protein [Streptomyces triculaminicus]